jgi:hypothetical protein
MADIMTEVALSADVTGLATAVAGLWNGFEGLSAVDIYRTARRKCMQRAAGVVAVGGCEWRNEKGVHRGTKYVGVE